MGIFKLIKLYNRDTNCNNVNYGSYYIDILNRTQFYDNTVKELLIYYIKNLGYNIKLALDINLYKDMQFNIKEMKDLKYFIAIELSNAVFNRMCINTNINECVSLRETVDLYCYKYPKYNSNKMELVEDLQGKLKADLIDIIVNDRF